jgi:hypothetical protein
LPALGEIRYGKAVGFPKADGFAASELWLDVPATLRPNSRSCANLDHGQRSVSYSERRPGYGFGVSAASITRRWLALSPSSCGTGDIKRQIARWRTLYSAHDGSRGGSG